MEIDDIITKSDELADSIRRMLESFRSETGVTPFVTVEWLSHQPVESRKRVFSSPTVTVDLRV